MRRNRAFTLIELLTVMAIISLLIGLLLPALATARAKAQLTKDQAQLKEIHRAWITFSREYDGVFPTPGLINRLPVDIGNGTEEIPGRGPEDLEANVSSAIYSVCIMQNYFEPQIAIAPTEPSGLVLVKDDFNWDCYSPADDIYWDADADGQPCGGGAYVPFAVDLTGNEQGWSNTSYSHLPVCGDRKIREWKDSMNSRFAAIANRGVEAGSIDDLEDSITRLFHGGREEWNGNIVYNDNHLSYLRTFWPENITYLDQSLPPGSQTRPDNLYRNDSGQSQTSCTGIDSWLVLYGYGQLDEAGEFNELEWD